MNQKAKSSLSLELKEAYNFIQGANRILLATHENPDADGLGAMLSLYSYLARNNFEPFAFCKDIPGEQFDFLPGINMVKNRIAQERFDLIIGLDYGDLHRLNLPKTVFSSSPKFITIDHHLVGEPFGDLKIVYPDFSSTSEIIFQFFKENNIEIDKEIATLLFSGILVDTGGFSHITTSPEVLRIAGDLLGKGLVPHKIARSALVDRGRVAFKIWGRALSRLKKDESLGMAFTFLSVDDFKECNASPDDISGIIPLINTVSDARFSLLLAEQERGIIRGSIRSEKYKGIDVCEIAKAMGGGGHKYAAGFTRVGDIDSILEEVKKVVKNFQEVSNITVSEI